MPWGLRWRDAAGPQGGREVESAARVPSFFSLDLVHTTKGLPSQAKSLSVQQRMQLAVEPQVVVVVARCLSRHLPRDLLRNTNQLDQPWLTTRRGVNGRVEDEVRNMTKATSKQVGVCVFYSSSKK